MIRAAQILRRFAFEEWGGTENVVWNSTLAMRKIGVESEILATQACSATGDEERDGIRIRRFPYFYPNFPMTSERKMFLDKKGGNPYSFSLKRYLASQDFTLYHIHTAGRMAQFVRQTALKRKRPYLITFHGGQFDVPASETEQMLSPLRGTFPYGGILDRLRGWRSDFLADASGLICVGANELPELKKRYPDKEILHLPNGVDPERFRRVPAMDIREEYNIPRDRFLILCVSRIDYQKNQKQLLKIAEAEFAEGRNPHILLMGPITAPNYYKELCKEAEEAGLTDRITIVPGVPPGSDRMLAAYHGADVFILPSHHEPFGIVVLEAWSAGLPVIAARIGGLQYLVENGQTGFLCSADRTEDYVSALRELENPDIRSGIIRNAARKVEEYSWDRIASELLNFYEKMISINQK